MADGCTIDTFEVQHASRSDLGMRRGNNQDALAVHLASQSDWASRGHFFMVADGMGAHAAGELASKLAVDNIPHSYRKATNQLPPAALRQAVRKANDQIYAKGQSSAEFHGMGTTCSCLVLLPGASLIAHVGDSRVYRFRDGKLEQLTFDHSLVWEMAAASHTTAEKVPSCIPKNVITRSLGPHPSVNVDLEGPFQALPGDRYLLCSDGLTAVVEDELLGTLLRELPPDETVDTLTDLANLRGGPDNISIVVAAIAGESTNDQDDTSSQSVRCRCKKRMLTFGLMAVVAAAVGGYGLWQGNPVVAIVAGLITTGAIAAGLAPLDKPVDETTRELGGPYGNGPYRDLPCDAESAVPALADTFRQLLDLQDDENAADKQVDWSHFATEGDAAAKQAAGGQHAVALRRYSRAIRELMGALRTPRPSPSDSSIR